MGAGAEGGGLESLTASIAEALVIGKQVDHQRHARLGRRVEPERRDGVGGEVEVWGCDHNATICWACSTICSIVAQSIEMLCGINLAFQLGKPASDQLNLKSIASISHFY